MKTIIKILKGTAFGLFKIHLWLPVLYSIVFLIIAIAAGLKGAWVGYAIGLIITLLGSVALTYYFSARKVAKGKYSEKKTAAKEPKRLPAAEPEEIIVRNPSRQNYAPPPPMPPEPQPMYHRPAYDPQRDLYPQGYASQASRSGHGLGYDPRAELYENNYASNYNRGREQGYDPRAELYENNYANGNNRGREHGYDPRAELYGVNPTANSGRPTSTEARQSLYASDIPEGSHPGRADASSTLYPAREAEREELERKDASNALYPEHKQASFDRYDQASASGTLYPESSPMHFDSYDRGSSSGALYASKQPSDYKTFSPYVQPVNSVLPKRDAQPSLYNQPAPAPVAPAYDEAAQLRRRDEEFLSSVGTAAAAPAKIGRRREVPLQIYATKADDNTYVYEYADRFEFIKLLEDGNKELLKTEFKSVQ